MERRGKGFKIAVYDERVMCLLVILSSHRTF